MSGSLLTGKLISKFRPLSRFFLLLPLFYSLFFIASLSAETAPLSELIPQITQKLNQQYLARQSLRGYLELELSQPGISPHRSFGQLAFQREDEKLYFKTFSQLTPHYFTLISKGQSFWLQIPKTKTIYTGPLDAIGKENFELKITPQDFRKVLVPNPVEQTPDNIRVEEQPKCLLLTLYTPVAQPGQVAASGSGQTFKEREVCLDKQNFHMLKDTRFSANGNPYLEIRWEEFENNGAGESFPTLITLFKPATGYLLRLKFKKWAVAGKIPEGLFEVAHSEGYQTQTISR